MNLQTDQISALCGQLALDQVACDWAGIAQRAADEGQSFAQFLQTMLTAELDARNERKRQALLKFATLPATKTLEQYDFGFASGAPKAQIPHEARATAHCSGALTAGSSSRKRSNPPVSQVTTVPTRAFSAHDAIRAS